MDYTCQHWSYENVRRLINGEIPAVRLKDFARREEVHALLSAYGEMLQRSNSIEEVTRIGISQYQEGVRGDKRSYFELAKRLKPVQQQIFSSSFNPNTRIVNALKMLGFDVKYFKEPGFGAYHTGNIKVRHGTTPVHIDFAPQDSTGWLVGQADCQLAWNLYLNEPAGGKLRIWHKQWQPDDDCYLERTSYCYRAEVVEGVDSVAISPVIGDVILINSRNYHAVEKCDDRKAYGCFISVFSGDRLRLWS